MLHLILSLGSVYAFIPVVVIFILILAARGSIGRDFFEVFGIASLVGWTKGIATGGAGKGIGRGRAYKSNAERTAPAAGQAGRTLLGHQDTFRSRNDLESGGRGRRESGLGLKPGKYNLYARTEANPGGRVLGKFGEGGKRIHEEKFWRRGLPERYGETFHGELWGKYAGDKTSILGKMSDGQIHSMLKQYGLDNRTAGMDKAALAEFAVYNLSLIRISDYYDRNVRPSKKPGGTPEPLRAPESSPYPQGVRMAIKDWYKNYYNARRGKVFDTSIKSRAEKEREAARQQRSQAGRAPSGGGATGGAGKESSGNTSTDSKLALMSDMSLEEIMLLCNSYGIPAKNIKDRDRYAAYAASMIVDPGQISRFKEDYLKRGSAPQSPDEKRRADLIGGMSLDDIQSMVNSYGNPAIDSRDRGEWIRYASSKLSTDQVEKYINSRRKQK